MPESTITDLSRVIFLHDQAVSRYRNVLMHAYRHLVSTSALHPDMLAELDASVDDLLEIVRLAAMRALIFNAQPAEVAPTPDVDDVHAYCTLLQADVTALIEERDALQADLAAIAEQLDVDPDEVDLAAAVHDLRYDLARAREQVDARAHFLDPSGVRDMLVRAVGIGWDAAGGSEFQSDELEAAWEEAEEMLIAEPGEE